MTWRSCHSRLVTTNNWKQRTETGAARIEDCLDDTGSATEAHIPQHEAEIGILREDWKWAFLMKWDRARTDLILDHVLYLDPYAQPVSKSNCFQHFPTNPVK